MYGSLFLKRLTRVRRRTRNIVADTNVLLVELKRSEEPLRAADRVNEKYRFYTAYIVNINEIFFL
jgi:hypothetical protein